ncbi:SGNH/GDSL hydrolase family protein [Rhodococcus sp. IEGM 1409]|uniref:SGNH/GDSL hydrolase family protein n=1 Tax=Rhodococcus sp. IEGM 1409 TaxID=3047082 RepID=UPI0024B85250|nr:SGNH/GDSL hydrolase family protein [Rhodococcus sp. IEGM 1409]MDI9898527.1 SGNH/GDSL hydrolase family protein [Rhodococcus sp. IEGM 1409]
MTFVPKFVRALPKRSLLTLASLAVVLIAMFTFVVVDRTAATRTLATFVDSREESVPQLTYRDDIPTALWVGDSFTQGGAAYPRIICAQLGCYCNIDAQGSTGFINEGAPEGRAFTSRIIDRLPTSIKHFEADLIILDGGRNDMSSDPNDVLEAMTTYVDAIRGAWPAAELVIIVPYRIETEPSYAYSEWLPGIEDLASSAGAVVLDPYVEGWFDGADTSKMVIEDNFHPNEFGNSYIASKIKESLERAHVVTPGSPNGGLG